MNGDEWAGGRKIFGSFVVSDIRPGPLHTDYVVSQAGRRSGLLVRVPRAGLFTREEQLRFFADRLKRLVGLGMHPHVEACFGIVAGDIPAYFLENLEGSTLTDWLGSGKPTFRSLLSVFIQVCHGLEYLHSAGIFQRKISCDRIIITSGSLAKIKDVVRPSFPSNELNRQEILYSDIKAMCGLLRLMLSANSLPSQHHGDTIRKGTGLSDHLRRYAAILRPVLQKCSVAAGLEGYPDISSLRNDLNTVYRRAYGLDCPYFTFTMGTALQAESRNNQAVVCFATGRFKETLIKLQQALAIQDRLPEAVYNLILFKLRSGLFPLERIRLMIDAAMAEGDHGDHLHDLKGLVEKMKGDRDREKTPLPSLLLCLAPVSLSLYRQSGKWIKKYLEIENHFHNLRYEACLRSLLSAWREKRFANVPFLSRFYDRLLGKSDKKEIAGVQRLATLPGSGRPVEHLAYLPGTRKILAAEGGDLIRIRNYAPGGKNFTISTDGQPATGVVTAPDGGIIAVGTAAGEIIFWGSKAGYPLLRREIVHQGRVNALAFSRDGRFFVSGGADGAMVIRTIATARNKMVSAWDDRQITCLSFVADGLELVSASDDGEVKIWSARGKKCLHRLTAHAGPVEALAVASKGDFFVTSGAEEIKIWDLHTGDCLQQLPGHRGGETLVLLLDDNRHLVSAGMDDMILIHDLIAGKVAALLDGRGNGIRCLVRGSRPHVFFAGQQGGALLIWKIIYNLVFA